MPRNPDGDQHDDSKGYKTSASSRKPREEWKQLIGHSNPNAAFFPLPQQTPAPGNIPPGGTVVTTPKRKK